MEHHQWLHSYDAQGKRRSIDDLPKKIDQLSDDPYRSLVSAVRHTGGCVKDPARFAEFLWADFFRRRIKLSLWETQPEAALQKALALAHSQNTAHLPGWCEHVTNEH
jgi:hypothetical protein